MEQLESIFTNIIDQVYAIENLVLVLNQAQQKGEDTGWVSVVLNNCCNVLDKELEQFDTFIRSNQ